MSAFQRLAGEILDAAANGEGTLDLVVLTDWQGAIRIMDACGWSVSGLAAEFGSQTIYRIQRSGESVSVHAWEGYEQCCLARSTDAIAARLQSGISSCIMP